MDLNSPKMRPGVMHDKIRKNPMKFFQIETTNIYNDYRAIPWIVSLFNGPFILQPLFQKVVEKWFEKSGSRNLVQEIWFEKSG